MNTNIHPGFRLLSLLFLCAPLWASPRDGAFADPEFSKKECTGGNLTVNAEITHLRCGGDSDGVISLAVSGGRAPYTYDWDILAEDNEPRVLTGLGIGTYNVIVTDRDGCTGEGAFSVNQPDELQIWLDFTEVGNTCNNDQNGRVNLEVIGGTPEYTYFWNSGEDTQDISGKPAGTYSVTVTDANGCEDSGSFEVKQIYSDLQIVYTEVNDVKCNGQFSGSIKVDVAGGSGFYRYRWSVTDGETPNNSITGLKAGNYGVTVTASDGCQVSNLYTITEPSPIITNLELVSPVVCMDGGVGVLKVNPTGGTVQSPSSYGITWRNGQSGATVQYGDAGTYYVEITDENGCRVRDEIYLPLSPDPVFLSVPEQFNLLDNVYRGTIFETDQPTAYFVWKVLETENIDTNDPSYRSDGQSANPVEFKFVLQDKEELGNVLLSVVPVNGNCKGDTITTRAIVRSGDCPVLAAEIFSPNGDQENDTWTVEFPPSMEPDDYSVTVFSRGGQKVYQANTMSEAWTGEGCPDGPYFYIIEDRLNGRQCRGAVSILR